MATVGGKHMTKYDIAFSYASEQREIIKQYSEKLQRLGLSVFIDTEHPELFVFNHVPETLKSIYDNDEIVMLIFLSKEYVNKDFTKYESHIAFDRLLTEKRLSIIKLDASTLSWLPSSFFYYDINKYTCDEICQSLYNAIRKYQIPNIENLFKGINEFILSNFQNFNCLLANKTCVIYNIESTKQNKIKITLNVGLHRILFYYYKNTDTPFPIAEIYISEKSIVLENRGFPNTFVLEKRYHNENELQSDLKTVINNLLEKL